MPTAGKRLSRPAAASRSSAPRSIAAAPVPVAAAPSAPKAIAPRLIAPGPRAEWRYGELTVIIGERRAELRYAREPVGASPTDPAAIALAVERARARLAARSRTPDELLPALAQAYQAVVRRRGGRPGDRVPLVELRDEIAGAATTRAQFAWDLARLRRERRLTIGERRIDLGVASGHAATRRSQVVWIENDGGGGSYFQTFRLIAQEVRS